MMINGYYILNYKQANNKIGSYNIAPQLSNYTLFY